MGHSNSSPSNTGTKKVFDVRIDLKEFFIYLFNISVSGGRTKDRRREQRQSRRKRKSSRACHLFTGLYLSGDYNVMGLSIPPAGLPVMLHALIYSQWIVGMCLPGKAILVGT